MLPRRSILQAGAATALMFAPMINCGRFRVFANTTTEYSSRAIELVERTVVMDMLSLLHPLDNLYPQSPRSNMVTLSGNQLKKIRASGINVFHPAINIGGPDAKNRALEFVATLNAVIAEHSDQFIRIDDLADVGRTRIEGKQGVIIGIQNSDHFRSPDDVDRFYHLGQRISQLTYNTQNLIGTGSTDRVDAGLSDFGVRIVERMNDVGMAVDTSHCGDKTTLDAISISARPVLITHSNCRALNPGHPRCKPDEVIIKAAARGGVMGITGVRNFVRNHEPTTIEHLIDQYEHVIKIAGIDHVGIGSDSDPDGYDDMTPELLTRLKDGYKGSYGFRDKLDTDGFDHPMRVFDLTEGLIRRGYNNTELELILGGNFRRVLGEILRPV